MTICLYREKERELKTTCFEQKENYFYRTMADSLLKLKVNQIWLSHNINNRAFSILSHIPGNRCLHRQQRTTDTKYKNKKINFGEYKSKTKIHTLREKGNIKRKIV